MPDDRSISAESLRQRIANTRAAGERLDQLDYLKRLWLASYAADVDVLGDCLEELLDQGIERVTPFATRFADVGQAARSKAEIRESVHVEPNGALPVVGMNHAPEAAS